MSVCGTLFRCTVAIGAPEPRRRFTLSGRLFSLHRLSGVRELRKRVRPDGAAPFLHRKAGAHELPQACSPFPGGKFFAEPQRGIRRLRTAGATPYPRRWAKRKDNLRFSFLFELLPFPCFLIWRRLPTCDRSEIGYGRGFFLPCLSQPVRSVRYRSATHVIKSTQAQHDRVAQLFGAL